MYELELQAVMAGLDFLSVLLQNDYSKDPTFDKDDLRAKMLEIDRDVVNLFNQIPFESIGNLHEERFEMPDSTMAPDDMEDEVVVCERAIHVTIGYLKEISLRYLDEPFQGQSLAILGGKTSDDGIQRIMDRLESYKHPSKESNEQIKAAMDRVASYFPSDQDPDKKKKHRWTADKIIVILLFIVFIAAAIYNR